MRHPLRLCSLAAVILLLASAGEARALGYTEHCQISNRGFRWAARHHVRPDTRLASHGEWARSFASPAADCTENNASVSTYGDLVALVDNTTSPLDYYVLEENPEAHRQLGGDQIAWDDVIRRFAQDQAQHLIAMRRNDDHFQNRGLFGFWYWHRQAVAAAAAGKLQTALVFNAYADHLLEDHFAPGHVMSPRRRLHDVPSMAIHDYYNRRGMNYYPSRERVGELAALLAGVPADSIAAEIPGLAEACGGKDAAACLQEADTIRLFGDQRTHRSPLQQLFVSLVIARSVGDLFASYAEGAATNSFEEYAWNPYYVEKRARVRDDWTSPRAETAFGAYEKLQGRSVPQADGMWTVSVGAGALHDTNTQLHLAVERVVFAWLGNDWATGFEGGELTPRSALLLGVETFGRPWEPVKWGPTLRYLLPIPLVDLQFSVVGGIRGDGLDVTRWDRQHIGGRGELGFGLINVGFGVGWEVGSGKNFPVYTTTVQAAMTRTLFGTVAQQACGKVPIC